MDTAPLTLFARKVSASNRLLFADLRRLRRDILPDGITSREEVEVLLGLDHLEGWMRSGRHTWPRLWPHSSSQHPSRLASTRRPRHGSSRC
jgi:hypothetical protein